MIISFGITEVRWDVVILLLHFSVGEYSAYDAEKLSVLPRHVLEIFDRLLSFIVSQGVKDAPSVRRNALMRSG